MQVPVTPGQTQGQEMPSEANLLMALAEMHKQGRFKVAGDVVPFPDKQPMTNEQRNEALKFGGSADKMQTQRILSRALGGRDNVLPIRPK